MTTVGNDKRGYFRITDRRGIDTKIGNRQNNLIFISFSPSREFAMKNGNKGQQPQEGKRQQHGR